MVLVQVPSHDPPSPSSGGETEREKEGGIPLLHLVLHGALPTWSPCPSKGILSIRRLPLSDPPPHPGSRSGSTVYRSKPGERSNHEPWILPLVSLRLPSRILERKGGGRISERKTLLLALPPLPSTDRFFFFRFLRTYDGWEDPTGGKNGRTWERMSERDGTCIGSRVWPLGFHLVMEKGKGWDQPLSLSRSASEEKEGVWFEGSLDRWEGEGKGYEGGFDGGTDRIDVFFSPCEVGPSRYLREMGRNRGTI